MNKKKLAEIRKKHRSAVAAYEETVASIKAIDAEAKMKKHCLEEMRGVRWVEMKKAATLLNMAEITPTRLKFLRDVQEGKYKRRPWPREPSEALTDWALQGRFVCFLTTAGFTITKTGKECIALHEEEKGK